MTFARWREHFERNRLRALPELRGAHEGMPADWVPLLARSLAVFQLGESKGGRLASEIDAIPGLDDDYRAAIKLFVAEEQRHGQLLELCVKHLGGSRLRQRGPKRRFPSPARPPVVASSSSCCSPPERMASRSFAALHCALPAGP